MRNRTIASLAAMASAAATVITMTATPANAYSGLTLLDRVSAVTDYCPCRFNDNIDGTYFEKDAGGAGFKVIHGNASRHEVAKVEFHPYGEILYVYDVKNDGDTLYYKVSYEGDGGKWGLYAAPSTSNVIDVRKVNLDIPEGRKVTVTVYDDKAMKKKVMEATGRA
ncbi:hypothetical protein K7395_11040 [Streptomyces filamentosus]|uniref:Secreted protein n=2 Tax=Streptomyces filamentosus TaxID=67294 RepID=A0ABY4USK5_STRFL|nr:MULTISPECIES: hypothetical protein [Streptomyces]ESU49589.1 secreted protein [Streptomyces sp. HCCB10043]USC47246.1 hypothetical protein K7395_11040 [Streptomyces filamentosus]